MPGNPLRGEVPITLRGNERLLRFTHEAIAKLEDEFNLQATQFLALNLQFPKLSSFRKMLVIGLQHKWPKIKIEDVNPDEDESLEDYFKRTQKALKRAFNLAFTGKDDDAETGEGDGDATGDGSEKGAKGDDSDAPDAPTPTE